MTDPADTPPIDHLWQAAHEFLQAMRKLVDAADDFVKDQRDRPADAPADPHVRRIDIDDESQ
jgi:hypothetical protein